ncbi:MAG TPA: hypothetical protein PLQ56_16880 [Aggregatilineales bacterium]|nr:hypothetical protein [Aggregatilineales bacterium]
MNRTWIPIVLIVGLLIAGVLLVNTTQTLSTTQTALTAAYVTGTAGAVSADSEATRVAQAAATDQASALNAAAQAAGTAQANALRDAANNAERSFNATLIAGQNAAATTQAEALTDAENVAATAQANALQEAAQAAGTQQANGLTNIRNAQATALANAIAQAQSAAAAEQALALQAAQETAAADQASALQAAQSTASAQQNDLQATIAAQSTLMATAEPTAAPASSSNADIPDGWVRIEGYEVALWLPPTWQGGDLRKNSDAILDMVGSLDPTFAQGVEMLRQNPDAFRLYAFDTAARIVGEINLNIITQPLPFDLSVELLMPSIISTLPDIYTVLEDDIIQVNGQSAGVLVADISIGPVTVQTIQFFMVRDGTAWVVSLTTGVQDVKESRAFAEQIIQTIEFLEP